MSVDETMVARIAKLSRLALEPEEGKVIGQELNQILSWIEQLQSVNTDGVEPVTAVIANSLRLRDDVVNDGGKRGAVLANAPQAEAGFFAVPKVIE
jgi:aspartyl-tRNA(Asn)/glutamyl-tRNA(Gln) amidotransferase subunit C